MEEATGNNNSFLLVWQTFLWTAAQGFSLMFWFGLVFCLKSEVEVEIQVMGTCGSCVAVLAEYWRVIPSR